MSWFGRSRQKPPGGADTPAAEQPEPLLDAAAWGQGDRGRPAVQSVGSVQAHVSRVLGIGLVALVAGGLVVMYYARVWSQPAQRRTAAQQRDAQRAQGELSLPPLESLAALRAALHRTRAPAGGTPPAPAVPVVNPATVLPLLPSAAAGGPTHTRGGGPRRLSARERAERRLLRSPVFAYTAGASASASAGAGQSGVQDRDSEGDASVAASAPSEDPYPVTAVTQSSPDALRAGSPRRAESSDTRVAQPSLAARPPAVGVAQLPDLTWVLPKGASLDCTLETAIDSTLQGMTTCVTAIDVFGADGRQVVLPRGTQLVGETHGTVRAGQARVQVLWTEARTPTGVIVALESPGTDPLGRAGLPGRVDRQFGERFGAAVLLSIIDGALQAAVASQQSGGAVYVSPSGAPSVMTELLKERAGLPPRIVKAQGDRVAILVARNVDFRAARAAHRSPADRTSPEGSY